MYTLIMIHSIPFLICFILRLISQSEAHQGIFYVILYSIFLITLYVIKNKIILNQKSFILSVGIAGLLLCGTQPILENDQFRYLWEGKVLFEGENPYIKAPSDKSLNHIVFPERDKIAYNKISSIYPPGAIFYFSLFANFSYQTAMVLMQIINLILVLILYKFLGHSIVFNYRMLWILPFLYKEYVQSVHIDLLAFIPFIYFLTTTKRWKKETLFWSSVWIKWLPLVLLPARLLQAHREKNLKSLILSISLGGFSLILMMLILFKFKFQELSGPYAFTLFWKWNAGLYQFLQSSLNLDHLPIKIICLLIFSLFYGTYLIKGSGKIKLASLLIFSTLFFTAPVFNAWYGIWILFPALSMKKPYFLIYSIAAYFSYILYDYESLYLLSSFLTHIWFLAGMQSLFYSRSKTC